MSNRLARAFEYALNPIAFLFGLLIALVLVVALFGCSSCASHPLPAPAPPWKPDEAGDFDSVVTQIEYESSYRVSVECKDPSKNRWGSAVAVGRRTLVTAAHLFQNCDVAMVLVIDRLENVTQVQVRQVDDVLDIAVLDNHTRADSPYWTTIRTRRLHVGEQVCVVAGQAKIKSIRKCGWVAQVLDGLVLVAIGVVPGNSGGPLYDENGAVVGIVSQGSWAASGEKYGLFISPEAWVGMLQP